MNTEKKGVAPASPFSYATKQPGGDKTHRPPDTAARLRPTKQPVYFTTEQPGGDNYILLHGRKINHLQLM